MSDRTSIESTDAALPSAARRYAARPWRFAAEEYLLFSPNLDEWPDAKEVVPFERAVSVLRLQLSGPLAEWERRYVLRRIGATLRNCEGVWRVRILAACGITERELAKAAG